MRFLFVVPLFLSIVTTVGLERTRAAEGPPGGRDPVATGKGSQRMTGSVRIVALGDSITNGAGLAGVKEAETFREIARRELTEKLGGKVVGVSFIIELSALRGRDKLSGYDIFSLITY